MRDDGGRRRAGRNTQRGFGTRSVKERADGSAPQASSPEASTAEGPQRPSAPEAPPIEVEWVQEHGPPALLEGQWRAYEVWTSQHIYVLGDDLCCLEIVDRASGCAEANNEIIGARLIGGEVRDARGMIREVFHPLPQRGSRAVFSKAVGDRQRMSETSPVTRMVLRQRVVSLRSADEAAPVSWKHITGRHELP